MQQLAVAELSDLGLSELRAAVGKRAFERGQRYARGKRVMSVSWEERAAMLTGSVLGSAGLYSTAAYFEPGANGQPVFSEGECSCPVSHNCKHVAALVIAARGVVRATGATGRALAAATVDGAQQALLAEPAPALAEPARTRAGSARALVPARAREPSVPPPPRPAPWEAPLRQLIEAPDPHAQAAPIAVELTLQGGTRRSEPPRLIARLMRPGARGGWVNGQLSWSGLDHWHVRNGAYRADHLALVGELYALHRVRLSRSANYYYHYGYGGSDRTLDLSELDGAQLWSLLEEGSRVGLRLIHSLPELGEVRRHRGELVLDVCRQPRGGLAVRAQLRTDVHPAGDRALEPVRFLGASGRGLVCLQRAEDADVPVERRRLALVHLTRPASPELQRLLLDGTRLRIPEDELDRFAQQLCPALSRIAPVVSSDESFTAPEVSGPELVLRVSHGPEHRAQAAWEWLYRVGEASHRVPLGEQPDGAGFRDAQAEQAILAEATIVETGLEHFGLLDQTARPAGGAPVTLHGLEAMRLATEALPRLEEQGRFSILSEGERPDYRDVGETLEVGVSTHERAGERDWFDLGVTISVEGRELLFAEVFTALARGEPRLLLPDGAHFSLQEPRLQALRALIEEARDLSDSPSATPRISRYQASLWSELAALGIVREQAGAWQRQVDRLMAIDELADHEPPASLRAELRPYQLDGFRWLASLWELELGGILADDMGLGKTLQALGLIVHARERDPALPPFLIVAPTSVVPNWVTEAERFAPGLRVTALTDTLARAGATIEQALDGADVLVTTYTLLRLDAEAHNQVSWAGVILDEAQYVKNHQAKTYRCVRQLDAPVKLALTGTPMENNLMELWSLLSITAPGLFPDPSRFSEGYARQIERRGDRERLARLRRRIKPLVKRRTKELVASELPAKQEQELDVELHPRHRKLYDTRLQRERQKILGLIDDFDRNRFTILRSITILRQLSLHPGLVDPAHNEVPCAKLQALVEQLQDVVGGGHRALVFSQFTSFLARVRARLDQDGIGYAYLDGRTRQRKRVLDSFKQGRDPVFLISLKAGGFGLNLTEADYCFLLDPWWNPAVETQAIDRTHRIGQTRPVMVYRLVSRNTIEEKVVALARRKAELFRGVMDDGELFASRLTAEDIRGLLG